MDLQDYEAVDNTFRQISAQASFFARIQKARMASEVNARREELSAQREAQKDFRDIVSGR